MDQVHVNAEILSDSVEEVCRLCDAKRGSFPNLGFDEYEISNDSLKKILFLCDDCALVAENMQTETQLIVVRKL